MTQYVETMHTRIEKQAGNKLEVLWSNYSSAHHLKPFFSMISKLHYFTSSKSSSGLHFFTPKSGLAIAKLITQSLDCFCLHSVHYRTSHGQDVHFELLNLRNNLFYMNKMCTQATGMDEFRTMSLSKNLAQRRSTIRLCEKENIGIM